ncbi:MAG: hypothetical protein VKJ46_10165 [Leptolyngbyaceae bacterium]|nr:hypothetical protein [Leptolyngbyaceae bacterium]
MKREVVRDFLNLPGIAGVALMDGRSRPYFCGVDQSLNFQQKEALTQGIRQVVETTPEDFESFEFQFSSHLVYIYKLDQGMILLVLAQSGLVLTEYLPAIEQVKQGLQEDVAKAISTFRLLASEVTGSHSFWKPPAPPPLPKPLNSPDPNSVLNGSKRLPPDILVAPGVSSEAQEPVPPPASTTPPPTPEPTVVATQQAVAQQAVAQQAVDLKELLAALNHLSQFTTQYLGTAVISNYWKSSRPNHEWLNNFQIDRAAQFTYATSDAQSLTQPLNAQQHQWLQEWVAVFIQRCAKVIRDFPTIVTGGALDERQKAILLN